MTLKRLFYRQNFFKLYRHQLLENKSSQKARFELAKLNCEICTSKDTSYQPIGALHKDEDLLDSAHFGLSKSKENNVGMKVLKNLFQNFAR